MKDNLFTNDKDYSNLISELNGVIAKHVKLNNNLKCLVMVTDKYESMAIFNIEQSEAKSFLNGLAESFDSPTATPLTANAYEA